MKRCARRIELGRNVSMARLGARSMLGNGGHAAQDSAMVRRSPLDDPPTAQFAWSRWRRMMALTAGITALTVGASFAWFGTGDEPLSIHFYIALALGIGAMMLLTGALMGLVFLSNGTGHDDAVGEDHRPEN